MGSGSQLIAEARGDRSGRVRGDNGQALVEFALIVPVLILVILGILDFSRALNYQNNLTSMANQAVRYATVGNCGAGCSSITTAVINGADSAELRNNATLTLCLPNSTSNLGDPIRAKASYQYHWLPGLVNVLGIPTTLTITASATQRLEKAATSGTAPYGTINSSC
jgi:Flp pilus assembly protein TadG